MSLLGKPYLAGPLCGYFESQDKQKTKNRNFNSLNNNF